jgi:hypothetical protein
MWPGVRAVLARLCASHVVVSCPSPCGAAFTGVDLGTDVIGGRDFVCPRCGSDLTDGVVEHLSVCTIVRVQAQDVVDRVRDARRQSRETAKTSQQLRDRADLLAREAEWTIELSRRIRRHPPGNGEQP